MDKNLAEFAGLLRAAQRVLIVTHIRPDGDAIGSLLGLGLTLQAAGKQVDMVSVDGVPFDYRFLSGVDQIRSAPQGDYDLSITVDCSDLGRAGAGLGERAFPEINIDHHITNEIFARVNLVDPQAVATAEILATCLPTLGYALTGPAAAALLTGLVTDTLGFRTSNITPKALRVAANLMEYGVDLPTIFQKTLWQRSYEAVEYWAAGLRRMQRNGGLVWTTLTLADRKETKYPGRDDADLINILSSINGYNIAVIFIEQSRRRVKVSWRAQPGFDVSGVAVSFGGGGHPAAAGAEVNGELAEVQERVIQATQALVNQVILERN
jgi:bifunctional oligoribonuclease and PAP phosphatase NrnA